MQPVTDQSGQSVGLHRVGWLLTLYVLFLPVQIKTESGLRIAPSDLFLICFVLLRIRHLRLVLRAWGPWHFGLVFAFGYATLVAAFVSGHVSSYALIQKDLGLVLLLLTYLVITSIARDMDTIRGILKSLIVGVTIHNAIALAFFIAYQMTGFFVSWMNYTSRLSGMLVDPNAYGGLLTSVFAAHVMIRQSQKPFFARWINIFTTLSLGLGILLTYSRSAWIGLAVVVATSGIIRPKVALRIWATLGLVFLGALAIFGRSYLSSMVLMAARPSQIEARMDYIWQAVDMVSANPILGIGLGRFYESVGKIIHNTPVWFLTEFGLVGLVVFVGFSLWFLVRAYRTFRRIDPSDRPLLLGLAMAHLSTLGLSLGIEALYQRHWWVFMALIASSYAVMVARSRSFTVPDSRAATTH